MSTSIPASTLEKFTNFGDLLRYLRRAAGLTQLELSVQVGYSHAQISRLEQNLRLPDIPTIEARFVPALGIEDEPKVVTRLLELAGNVRREDAPGLGLCPYKGLNYFDESDADLFVGREALTAKLTERVLALTSTDSPDNARFLAIVGASGTGKSSLVRAGLVPALRWNKVSADWQIHILTPTAHPLDSLAASLTSDSLSVVATSTLIDDLSRDPRSLQIFVKRQLQLENQARALLVIDQFEETFALCRSDEERTAFIGNLLTAASEADGSVIVIITLRADFYAHCASYIQLREALAGNQEYIGAMSDGELCRAIEEPARRGRWEFEHGLVDLLLHEVGHEPGALPLLSHALLETWHRRRGRTMTLSGYTSSGGVRGAIAETAETVFIDQFSSEQQAIARRIFLRLTELSDEASAADTRRRATFNELILKPEEATTTHAVLKALADARLIIINEDSAEVAHEALIREWPTLRGWLENNREGLRLHRQLTEAAHEWRSMNRTPDILYRGTRLAQAREWAVTHTDEMNALEHEFLTASIEASERETAEREAQRQRELEAARSLAEAQRQQAEAEKQRAELEAKRAEEQVRTTEQLRKRALYLASAFTLALVMALTALFFGAKAREAATAAQAQQRLATSRELALASITSLDVDPERSILLALEALHVSYTIEAEDALHRAVQASRLKRVIPAHEPGGPMMIALSPDGSRFVTAAADGLVKLWDMTTGKELSRFEGFYAAYSPDGKRLAVYVANNTIKMIDLATGKEIQLSNQIDASLFVAFSSKGSSLVTIPSNNPPKTWDSNTGEELAVFPGHGDLVNSVVFNKEDTRLLTASDDRTARIWDAATGEQLMSFSGHPHWVRGARYSPDDKRIATISANETYIWDANSGERLLTLTGHTDSVFMVAFSPDGSRLATGGYDRKIIIWDTLTGKELFTLSGHTGPVTEITFTSDGHRLLSSSTDGTVKIWDVGPSRELLTISATGSSGQIAFSMDDKQLATTDKSGAIKVWDVQSGLELITLPPPGSALTDVAFDKKGSRVFTATKDGQVKVSDSATGVELAAIFAHSSEISGIAISPDGEHLATASQDYKVKIWDVSSNTLSNMPLHTLEHSTRVFSVAFNTDGSRIATGSQEGNTLLWDTITGEEIHILRGHADFVSAIAFNSDGTRIVTSSWDGTAKIWDVSTSQELFTLGSHTGPVTSIAYSPDATRIATSSMDGTVKLWDAASGEELLTFFGDGSPIYEILFSHDGKLLATGGESGVRVYVLEITELIALAKTRVTRPLTSEECRKYLHLDHATCTPVGVVPTTTAFPPAALGRVCQVTNTPALYDNYFNEVIYKGLQSANITYGWDTKVLQSASTPDFAKNINEFLRGDCDLIVGSFSMADAIRVAAESNPDQKFWIESEYEQPPKNIWMQNYATDQAAFLAGYTAASITKTGKVGIFGGIDIPPVTDFMDGFALGIRHYNKKNGTDVELLGWDVTKHEGLFVGDFCCAAEGREITQRLLDQNADVVLPVAGPDVGVGALHTVRTHGAAYIIGVDTDWATTYPDYEEIILTSIMKNLDVSVVQAVKSIEEGTFTGGVHVGTLKTGEISLAPFYQFDSFISAKVKADLGRITKDIIDGKIKTKP
ncbi:MAG TPA: BMP family ABC transporter substrate-binding protein [Anaerolineales bacterium]|nr:BMP family ABC transporter substrate-binding protein [Anaerolineales bacterium]